MLSHDQTGCFSLSKNFPDRENNCGSYVHFHGIDLKLGHVLLILLDSRSLMAFIEEVTA